VDDHLDSHLELPGFGPLTDRSRRFRAALPASRQYEIPASFHQNSGIFHGMDDPPREHVTRLIDASSAGDRKAAADLLQTVYGELRKLAQARLNQMPPGQTLQATALVHEAYLRLVGDEDPGWKSKGHFFGAAARAMRNIIIDDARKKKSAKHGGGRHRASFHESVITDVPTETRLLELDAALTKLEANSPRTAQVVMLKYFTGLTIEQTALALEVSTPTVQREWSHAKSWLKQELSL
jgi:RNA polymerase sigma factor (TIGR02999 family)